MAVRPGEDITAVLFADLHYYYGPPTANPPHHRFDKGSYVYLFEDVSYRRARIEVANNAGTEDQDAFDGYLDSTHIAYSYKHPNLVTITVDSPTAQNRAPTDPEQWHLPTFDPQNRNKYMYRLHTLDIYFWTGVDALQFMNVIRRLLPAHQISIQGEPIAPPPHREEMSPIVQKLENVAISDPEYRDGKTRDSRTTSASFPGPPVEVMGKREEQASFVPMAYNPAAPAAPEVIQHREKTPPPPEDGAPNPLMAAASSDQGQSFGIPFNGGGFSGPPVQTPQFNGGGFSGPPAQTQIPQQQQSYFPGPPAVVAPQMATPQSPYAQHFQNTFAGPPTGAAKDSPYAQTPPSAHSIAAPAYQQQTPVNHFTTHPGSPSYPSATTPGVSSPGFASPPISGSYTTDPAPPGGFSNYQYQNVSNTQPLMTDYSIHQEVYRPTQGEVTKKVKEKGKEGKGGKGLVGKGPRGKLEDRAEKLERGMGSIFKKLEKKIG